MTDYANFRQRLDAVLRTLDVKQVQDFLIGEKQWQPGQPADPEYAIWMMIAGSATLQDLHEQARQWLVGHGHEADANAVLRRGREGGGKQEKKGERHDGKRRSSKGRAGDS
jgi:hypothetical protein